MRSNVQKAEYRSHNPIMSTDERKVILKFQNQSFEGRWFPNIGIARLSMMRIFSKNHDAIVKRDGHKQDKPGYID